MFLMNTRGKVRSVFAFTFMISVAFTYMGIQASFAASPAGGNGQDSSAAAAGISTDVIMQEIQKKFRGNAKKYQALAKKIEKRVRDTLAKTEFSLGTGEGIKRPLSEHPYLKLVEELSAAARADGAGKKNSDETQALLKKYPWDTVLELVTGLQDGSDRAIPKHENGFIDLGAPPDPVPGFPDLSINHYLYGFDEILSWKYRIKQGRQMVYLGRERKTEKPVMEEELPPWEAVRVYLEGYPPEAPLYAIPWLKHLLHSSLKEKRRAENGALSRMDETMAFLDSKWNGFYYENPCTRKPEALVRPVHMLFTEKGGFVYQFPDAKPLSMTGDIPFLSVRTYQEYGELFLGQKVDVGAFIRDTEDAEKVRRRFFDESVYLARYKSLIDLIARAILAPDLRYPAYLSVFDYPAEHLPSLESRTTARELDVPRKHALLSWAFAGRDPERLAAFLQENLLGKEANAFGKDVVLAVQFTLAVREKDREMVDGIAEHIRNGHEAGGSGKEGGWEAAAFEREFSPFQEYGKLENRPLSDYVAASHRAFNGEVTKVIRETAIQCVIEEIGDKWLTPGR